MCIERANAFADPVQRARDHPRRANMTEAEEKPPRPPRPDRAAAHIYGRDVYAVGHFLEFECIEATMKPLACHAGLKPRNGRPGLSRIEDGPIGATIQASPAIPASCLSL